MQKMVYINLRTTESTNINSIVGLLINVLFKLRVIKMLRAEVVVNALRLVYIML